MSDRLLISRRQFAAAAALAAPASTALASPSRSDTTLGPVDVLILWARLHGGLSGSASYGWFDGVLNAVAPGGAVETLCGYRGIISRRLKTLSGATGWRLEQRELSTAYPLLGGTEFTNPITGATVRPMAAKILLSTRIIDPSAAAMLSVSARGRTIEFDQPFRVVQQERDGSLERAFRESLSTTFRQEEDGRNHGARPIRNGGTMLRTITWPAWLEMGRSPGHVLCQARFAAGLNAQSEIPFALRRAFGGSEGLVALRFS